MLAQVAHCEDAPLVVELGGGTGAITQVLLDSMRPDGRLLVFEILPEFVEILRARFADSRLEIVPTSATSLDAALDDRGIGQLKCIVSSLPLFHMPRTQSLRILRMICERLAPDGNLVVDQRTPFRLGLLRAVFPYVRVKRLVLSEVPPSFVILCRAQASPPGTFVEQA